MTDMNAIKARLHSIPPSKLATLPNTVLKILKEDLPMLLVELEAARRVVEAAEDVVALEQVKLRKALANYSIVTGTCP